MDPENKPVRDLSISAHYNLSQCPDFLNQKSALQLQIETIGLRCAFSIIYHWHLDDDDPDMNDKVRMEETGDAETESGGVNPEDAEDHDEVDLGDMYI